MLQVINESNKYDGSNDRVFPSFTLELIDCSKHRCDSFKIKKHIVIENYTILMVVKGFVNIKNGESVSRGGLIFLPKFANAEIETEEKSEFIQIVFKLSGLKISLPKKTTVITVEAEISNRIEYLYRTAKFHSSIEGVKEAILLDVIDGLSKYLTITSGEVSVYQKICQWIESNAEQDISPQDVAAALGYSREHLNRIVKSIDDERLGDKIVKCRMENIKVLCAAKNLSIAEIADRLGFYSRELLCKYFKYHMGVSINDYRKKLMRSYGEIGI